MCPIECLAQIEARTPDDHLQSELNKLFDDILKIERHWAPFDESDIIDTKACL